MNTVKVRLLLHGLSVLVLISTFLPVLFVNLPAFFKSHHFYTTMWFFALLVFRPRIISDNIVFGALAQGILVCVLLLNTLYASVNDEFRNPLVNEFYNVIVAISIFRYYLREKDYLGLAKLVRITFYCIIITAALSIFTSYINPMYARDLIGTAELVGEDLESVLSFRKYGGGQYDFFSGIICLFPVLLYFYRNNSESIWNRKRILLFIALLFFCLIRVQIFANILISAVFISLCFIGQVNRKNSFIILGIMLVLALLVPDAYYYEFFKLIADSFGSDTVLHTKFADFAEYFHTGAEQTGTAYRAERFPLLLESFLTNPLTGGPYGNHHMYWMNKLAVFGLLGTLPFVIFLVIFVLNFKRTVKHDFVYFYLLAVFSIVSLGFMKALVGRNLWYMFFLVMPGLYFTALLKRRRTTNSRGGHEYNK